MKFKTLKEEQDEDWARFEKFKYTPDKREVGTHIKFEGERFDLNKYIPTSGCNLFHNDDMCEIFIKLRIPFSLNYWSITGRERYCQFIINEKDNISVFASGYGTGESICFGPGITEETKFKILREMAIDIIKKDLEHFEYNTVKELIIKSITIREMIFNKARCIDDLIKISNIYHMLTLHKLHSSKDRNDILTDDHLARVNEFNRDWNKLIKTKHYKQYIENKRKVEFKMLLE